MTSSIESEVLSFLKKLSNHNNNNNNNNKMCISLQDCEDWILFNRLHETLMRNNQITQRSLYYSLPYLYHGDYNKCLNQIKRMVSKIQERQQQPEKEERQKEQKQEEESQQQQQQSQQEQKGLVTTTINKFNLGITTSGKSLLFGNIRFRVSNENSKTSTTTTTTTTTTSSGKYQKQHEQQEREEDKLLIDVSKEPTGHVLSCNDALTCSHFEVGHLLIVEKEAVARTIISNPTLLENLNKNNKNKKNDKKTKTAILCIKGYPCSATKIFIQRLMMTTMKSASSCLGFQCSYAGDCDPHGLAIFMQVCNISSTSSQNNNNNNNNNNNEILTGIRWHFLRPSFITSSSSSSFKTKNVTWTKYDSRCIISVLATLENLLSRIQKQQQQKKNQQNLLLLTFLQSLREEGKIIKEKQLKVELEALSESQLGELLSSSSSC